MTTDSQDAHTVPATAMELWGPALRALDPPCNEAYWCRCGDWKPAADRQCWVCESLDPEVPNV